VNPTGADQPAISIRALTKRYGKFAAVSNLTLEVHPGEVLGFLGLNGAGKTTTIRILLDLLRPSSGTASLFGRDCQADGLRARSLVGYLPGEMGLYAHLTGREVLDFLAGLARQTIDLAYRRDLQHRLELDDSQLRRPLREYSTGMKRKLGLIQALQADPPLLILDEPTDGLDPLMQAAFYELIAGVQQRGRTVFMSSHVLSEVERICDRVALLRKGELVLLSTIDEVKKLAARRVRVVFTGDVPAPLATALPPGATLVDTQPHAWTPKIAGPLGPAPLASAEGQRPENTPAQGNALGDPTERTDSPVGASHSNAGQAPCVTLPPGITLVETQPRTWTLKVAGTLAPLLPVLSTLPVKDLEMDETRLEDVLIQYYREGPPS
jgi:ABC-2 type transport system ATP-binding protein